MIRRSIDQPTVATVHAPDYSYSDDNFDTIPIPVLTIDTCNGQDTGLKFAEVAELLTNDAGGNCTKLEGNECIQIGDPHGDHLVIEQDLVETQESESVCVYKITVAEPQKKEFCLFQTKIRKDGNVMEFGIYDEAQGVSRRGAFSGANGGELPADLANQTLHFTQKFLSVASTLRGKNRISDQAFEDVQERFKAPEVPRQNQPGKWRRLLGGVALSRLRHSSSVGSHHAVA